MGTLENKNWYKSYQDRIEHLNNLESIAIAEIKKASHDIEEIQKEKSELSEQFIKNLSVEDINVVC